MKFKYLFNTFYIILFLLCIRFLYYLYIHYIKNKLIQEIIQNWKERTNGIVESANSGIYTNDYFLYFFRKSDKANHIHLITNNFYYNYNDFIKLFFNPTFELIPKVRIGYVIKKNNKYLPPNIINLDNDAQSICYNIIKSYKTLDIYY